MIISASRRTDIPAFYSEWFMNRIRAGFCTVPNPVRKDQISRVSLKPEDVEVIVFWTRNAAPLMKQLRKLDARGYRYYFQYTIMDNPRALDPHCPTAQQSIETATRLADQIGPAKVIWRYDPIVFGSSLDVEFHKTTYERIARALHGYTQRSVISILDIYRKIWKRLDELAEEGFQVFRCGHARYPEEAAVADLMRSIAEIANDNGMEIYSCAEEQDLSAHGVSQGGCIDDDYISRVFGVKVSSAKDPSQRKACGCVVSKDIGAYDTCLFGCRYCYATSSFNRARANHEQHDPVAEMMYRSFSSLASR